MKTYLVTLTVIHGEYSKLTKHLVEADNEEDAFIQAVHNESQDPETLEEGDGGFYDLYGEFHYSLMECNEIPEVDYVVLKKYLP